MTLGVGEEQREEQIPRQLRRFLGGANNDIRYLIYEHKISDLFLSNLYTLLVVIFVLSRPYFLKPNLPQGRDRKSRILSGFVPGKPDCRQ